MLRQGLDEQTLVISLSGFIPGPITYYLCALRNLCIPFDLQCSHLQKKRYYQSCSFDGKSRIITVRCFNSARHTQ